MANQDVETLARKIVSLERRHAALARAQQLPSSSVRLAEGEDVMLPSAIQNGEDAYSEAGIIGGRTDELGNLIDSEVEYGTFIPDWIEGSAHSGDNAWDVSQIAIDMANEVETIVEELTNIPKAPTGLTELSNTGAFTSIGPRAEVGVSWTEVVTSVKDEPIGVDVYRVYVDGSLRVEETQPPTSISIPSGVSAEIRVSAVTEGLESDRSEALNITGALPTLANLAPTKPVLSSSHGSVRAVWDGLYTTPTLPGAHTIRVEARVGSGTWFVQGAALDKAGEQLVSVGKIGQSVQVRFRAFDQLQRLTGTSAVETITVAGVEFEDFDTASQNYILGIESKADEAVKSAVVQFAKNTSATTAPTSGWSTTRPPRGAGEHIWTRTLITYNDGNTTTTTPFSSTGDQGPQGVPGTPGTNGAATYTWIRYADDASGGGISNDPTGKTYIGFAYNKLSETETNTPGDYTWSLIKGEDGVPGADGVDGQTTYTWIKYSDNADGTGLYDQPTANTKYLGIAVNKTTQTESTNKADYTWSLFKGADGPQGVPGTPGANGATTYTWIRYADTAAGGGISNSPTGKKYIGFSYNQTTATESNTPGDYKWSLIQGEQGVPGAPGANGQTTYTWVRYSANSNGSPIQTTPQATTKYVGIAVNKSTSTPSSTPGDYTWSLFKGADGSDGVDGDDGADGISVTSVVRYYRLGVSKPGQPSGASPSGWDTNEPEYMEWQNLYYADKVTYSNGTVSWSTVQLSSAYTAAAQANAKADVLAAGQTVLGRSVNGLNRRFTTLDAPKRGVFHQQGDSVKVFEDLTPPFEGSDSWVEVSRNLFQDPGARGTSIPGGGFAAWAGSTGNTATQTRETVEWSFSRKAYRTTWTNLSGNASNGGVHVNPKNSFQEPGVYTVEFKARTSRGLTTTISWGDIPEVSQTSVSKVGTTGDITHYRIRVVVASPVANNAARIHVSVGTKIVGDWLEVSEVDIYKGEYDPLRNIFDGDYNPSPQMRTKWLGAPNASASVLEGEHPVGWNAHPSNGQRLYLTAGGLTSDTRNTTSEDVFIQFPGVSYLQGETLTLAARVRLPEPGTNIRSGLHRRFRVSHPANPSGTVSETFPNEAGEHNIKWVVNIPSDTSFVRLEHGMAGILEVLSIGAYPGVLPNDIQQFNNGDEWHQLGWKQGETEEDPDRLVIEHVWTWNGQDWVHYDIWAENVFAAGSVTAREIRFDEAFGDAIEVNEILAGRIGVDQLAPGTGSSIDISGNLSVVGLESQVSAAQDTATAATTSAGSAATAAALADSKAQAAQAAAGSVSKDLTEHKKAFTVTDGVPEVSTLDGEYKLRLDANKITMEHGGQETTWWEDSKFVVREIDIIQGMLANHWIESVGDHGTVIKPRNE